MLEDLQAAGNLFLCEPVLRELKKRDDYPHQWVQAIFPPASVLNVTNNTLNKLTKTIQWAKERTDPKFTDDALREYADTDKADAWLVAYAMEHNLTILTNETSRARKTVKVKIPDAAQTQGIECISDLELIRTQSIVFKRTPGL